MANAQHSSSSAEWYTPPEWIERVRRTLGEIDLDPCTSEEAQKVVKAREYYTAETDGLSSRGTLQLLRTYINPPGRCNDFSGRCYKRCYCFLPRKYFDKYNDKRDLIWLAYSLEQLLWMKLPFGSSVAIPHKRIKFIGAGVHPTHGNAFVLLSSSEEMHNRFYFEFSPLCTVFRSLND